MGECENTLNTWKRFQDSCEKCQYKDNGAERYQAHRAKCMRKIQVVTGTPLLTVKYGSRSLGSGNFTHEMVVKKYQDVTFSAPGFLTEKFTFELLSGSDPMQINVNLKPIPPPPPLFSGKGWGGIALTTASILAFSFGGYQLSEASDIATRAQNISGDTEQEARRTYDGLESEFGQAYPQGLSLIHI